MSKESEIIQSEFVSLISHELRTPLTSLLEGTAMLLEDLLGGLNEKQRRCIEIIREDLLRLNRVLMDILELSRIESGNVVMENSFFDIRDVLTQIRLMHEPKIRQKNLQVKEHVCTEMPGVFGDREKIYSILFNLFSNAVKYTPDGGRVEVRIAPDGGGPARGAFQMEVKDSGVGMSPAELPLIFDRFALVKRGGERKPGGLGLGLSITKAFVDLLGGKIAVESEPGKGSVFRVTLPLQAPKKGTAPLTAPAAAKPRSEKRILIADDETNIREMLAMRLELSGFEVQAVSSGEEAFEKAIKNPPDLVLLDWLMPGWGGRVTLQKFKEEKSLAAVPIVIISAKSDEAMNEKEELSRADGYILKPFSSEELLRTIRHLVSA